MKAGMCSSSQIGRLCLKGHNFFITGPILFKQLGEYSEECSLSKSMQKSHAHEWDPHEKSRNVHAMNYTCLTGLIFWIPYKFV